MSGALELDDAVRPARMSQSGPMQAQAAKGRNSWLDAMRGLGILLVVLGHSVLGAQWPMRLLGSAIYDFHMPFLIMVSGMAVWFAAPTGRIPLGRRALGLLVPYAAWTVVVTVLLVNGPAFGLRHLPTTLAVVGLNPRRGLWFLYILFELIVVLWLLGRLPGSVRSWVAAAAVACVVVPHLGGVEPWTAEQVARIGLGPATGVFTAHSAEQSFSAAARSFTALNRTVGVFGWRSVLWFLPFFLGGFLLGPVHKRLEGRAWLLVAIGAPLFAAAVALTWSSGAAVLDPRHWWLRASLSSAIGVGATEYVYVLARYLAAAAGIALFTGICGVLRGPIRPVLAELGKMSLGIYVCHLVFVTWVTKTGGVRAAERFVVAFTMAILLTLLLNKCRLTQFLLLGRPPRSWAELSSGITVPNLAGWTAFALVGISLWLRADWKPHLALAIWLLGGLLFASWRERASASVGALQPASG